MSVMVDHQELQIEELGLRTVGQVLSHLQRKDRLVVHVLIDGQEPDLSALPRVKESAVAQHTIFIETAHPGRMATEILTEVEGQLNQADKFKDDAADLLRKSQWALAMEKLSGCFSLWQHAQQAIIGTTQLLRIDLERVIVEGMPLTELLNTFTTQLRQIKSALEERDFVSLTDLLTYETTRTSAQWRAALLSLIAISGMESAA